MDIKVVIFSPKYRNTVSVLRLQLSSLFFATCNQLLLFARRVKTQIGKFSTVGRNSLLIVIAQKQKHLLVLFLLPGGKMKMAQLFGLLGQRGQDHGLKSNMGKSALLSSALPTIYEQKPNWKSDPLDGMSAMTSHMMNSKKKVTKFTQFSLL